MRCPMTDPAHTHELITATMINCLGSGIAIRAKAAGLPVPTTGPLNRHDGESAVVAWATWDVAWTPGERPPTDLEVMSCFR